MEEHPGPEEAQNGNILLYLVLDLNIEDSPKILRFFFGFVEDFQGSRGDPGAIAVSVRFRTHFRASQPVFPGVSSAKDSQEPRNGPDAIPGISIASGPFLGFAKSHQGHFD